MSAQGLLGDIKKHLPIRVKGKGPILELLRELGCLVDKNTPLQAVDAYRSEESGEIVCDVVCERSGKKEKVSAALTNLKLDITHPLYRKVKNYREEVVAELSKPTADVNRPSFKVGDLYRNR